jgi:titin
VIEGDFIGTKVTGKAALANGSDGVLVRSCTLATTIGGTIAGARNIISGNTASGVEIYQTSSTLVEGNYIGTDVTGAVALGNGSDGVLVDGGASVNSIGAAVAGAANVISGNQANGVEVAAGASTNTVAGNYVGTNAARKAALANHGDGIRVAGNANGNTIGGTTTLARNLVSGNGSYGLHVTDSGTSNNTVEGNYIGTDPLGSTAIGNARSGVLIESGAAGNTIGGIAVGTRNLISGNNAGGVGIAGSGTSGNLLEGNYIGTNASRAGTLGNGPASNPAVSVAAGASGNTVGGTKAAAGNAIANSKTAGVLLTGASTAGDSVLRNSIFGNVSGIALVSGANNNEAAPGIASVTTSAGTTTVAGTAPAGSHRIEVFVNPGCADPEGATFIGAVLTASGVWSLKVPALPAGQGVTATGTREPAGDTSQFSGCHLS